MSFAWVNMRNETWCGVAYSLLVGVVSGIV